MTMLKRLAIFVRKGNFEGENPAKLEGTNVTRKIERLVERMKY